MTDQRHSPEPWRLAWWRGTQIIEDANGAQVPLDDAVERANALAGLDPERVREVVEAAERSRDWLRELVDSASESRTMILADAAEADELCVLLDTALSRLEGKS